ncbi:MAG: FAD-dependent oxidoreductase, partial [Myxococcota bacterium]
MSVELRLDESEGLLRARSAQKIGIPAEAIRGLRIARRALDARRRGSGREFRFILHVDLELEPGFDSAALSRALASGRAQRVAPQVQFRLDKIEAGWQKSRVAVVGSGPAGLYAAWTLACNGVDVDVIERGPALNTRGRAVAHFMHSRELDPESNLLFGEGGAGTY